MNSRTAKKIRKYSKRSWWVYFNAIREWPWTVRLRFCWQVMFGVRLKAKKGLSKDQVLRARKPVAQVKGEA